MKLETFSAGRWQQRFQYKSFEPVLIDHEWTWEDAAINTLLEKANRALGELNAFSLIVPDKRAHNARIALSLLYRKPIINAGDVEQALSVSTPTANALINALVQLGILTEITGQQRWRSYAFKRYLNLFLS